MNELKMSNYPEIYRLYRLRLNKRQIERKTGVNRDTIRKHLNMDFDENDPLGPFPTKQEKEVGR